MFFILYKFENVPVTAALADLLHSGVNSSVHYTNLETKTHFQQVFFSTHFHLFFYQGKTVVSVKRH